MAPKVHVLRDVEFRGYRRRFDMPQTYFSVLLDAYHADFVNTLKPFRPIMPNRYGDRFLVSKAEKDSLPTYRPHDYPWGNLMPWGTRGDVAFQMVPFKSLPLGIEGLAPSFLTLRIASWPDWDEYVETLSAPAPERLK